MDSVDPVVKEVVVSAELLVTSVSADSLVLLVTSSELVVISLDSIVVTELLLTVDSVSTLLVNSLEAVMEESVDCSVIPDSTKKLINI